MKMNRKWQPVIMKEIEAMRLANSLPTTERHIMYLLEVRGFMNKKKDSDMKHFSKVMVRLREKKLIKNSEVVDFSRKIMGEEDRESDSPLNWFKLSLTCGISSIPENYMKSRWHFQRYFPIFVIEKEALAPIFLQTLEDYRVKVVPSKGFPSYPQMMEIIELMPIKQETKFFLFSDCDYAGYDAERDLKDRIPRYSKIQYGFPFSLFDVDRIALTPQQVTSLSLRQVPLNPNDTRAKNYPFLKIGCELDAMETKDLRALIIQSVESCISNRGEWNKAISLEKWGKKQLKHFSKNTEVFVKGAKIYP
jgi:hypothetical protein